MSANREEQKMRVVRFVMNTCSTRELLHNIYDDVEQRTVKRWAVSGPDNLLIPRNRRERKLKLKTNQVSKFL